VRSIRETTRSEGSIRESGRSKLYEAWIAVLREERIVEDCRTTPFSSSSNGRHRLPLTSTGPLITNILTLAGYDRQTGTARPPTIKNDIIINLPNIEPHQTAQTSFYNGD